MNNAAFVYTGMDRAIADSFLEQQERQNISLDGAAAAASASATASSLMSHHQPGGDVRM